MLLLEIEEDNQKAEQNERNDLEKKFRDRLQTRLLLEQQKEQNIRQQMDEREMDRIFRANQMEILAERDRIDQLTSEKKRQKLMEHHRQVREILEQNKLQRALIRGEELDLEKQYIREKEQM